MFPMWITIPDPQDPARKKWFPIAFIVSILWIAVFSYFMVWWASLTGEAFGISDGKIRYISISQSELKYFLQP